MSLTLVQRFYELAKQSSEAPALIVGVDAKPQELPWWFVKSKTKHFGLGLTHEGARPGDYFYLFPSGRPNWIYAELGALTMGLQTMILPPHTPPSALERLFRRFPPAYWMASPEQARALLPALRPLKSFKRLILDSDQLKASHLEGMPTAPLTFRGVFNSGIIHEARHHGAYRECRRSLQEDRIISPIQVMPDGTLEEKPWTYAHLNQLSSHLSHQCRQKKVRRCFAGGDMSVTLVRAASLYWPLGLGIPTVFPLGSEDFAPQIRASQASAALLGESGIRELTSWAMELTRKISPANSAPSPQKPGFWQGRRVKWMLRKELGKNFQVLLALGALPDPLARALEISGRVIAFPVKTEWFSGSNPA